MLYQTVSDPQQRLAKLTAKDPQRRRTSSGGSGLPTAGYRRFEDNSAEKRRTSLPSTASPQRFGWNPASPAVGKVSSHVKHGTDAWGSPIGIQDDASIEVAAGRAEVQDPRNGVGGADGPRMSFSEDAVVGTGSADSGAVALRESGDELMYHRGAHAVSRYPDAQLYSESEDEGGDGSGGGGDLDEDASVASATHKTNQDGAAFAPPDGRDDYDSDGATSTPDGAEGAGTTPGETTHTSWPQSPERRAVASWAGTSSSEELPANLRNISRPNMANPQAREGSSAATGGDDSSTQSLRPSVSVQGAEQMASDALDTGSTASSVGPMGSSETLTGRVGSASTSGAPVKRISWGQDQDYDPDGGGRNSSSSVRQEREEDTDRTAANASRLRCDEDQEAERLRIDCKVGQPQGIQGDGGVPTRGAWLNSSVESGGGAAALAASGVFDITGTSGEEEEGGRGGGVTVGEADSLEDGTIEERTWAPQHPELEPGDGQALEENAAGVASTEDSRRLIEHLMRQVKGRYINDALPNIV